MLPQIFWLFPVYSMLNSKNPTVYGTPMWSILMGMYKRAPQGLAFAHLLKIHKVLWNHNKMLGHQALKVSCFFLNFSSAWAHTALGSFEPRALPDICVSPMCFFWRRKITPDKPDPHECLLKSAFYFYRYRQESSYQKNHTKLQNMVQNRPMLFSEEFLPPLRY